MVIIEQFFKLGLEILHDIENNPNNDSKTEGSELPFNFSRGYVKNRSPFHFRGVKLLV